MIQQRNVLSRGSLALQINLASPIGPSRTVPELFTQDAAGVRAVKNVTFSLCKSSCTEVFTLWPCTPLKEDVLLGAKPQK
jgi:hypothetical protein